MSSPRILHVIDSLRTGGAETLLKRYFESGFSQDQHLFVLRRSEQALRVDCPNRHLSRDRGRYSIRSFLELRSYILKYDISIIHCHLVKSQIFGGLVRLLFFPNLKVVFHEHGPSCHPEVNTVIFWLFRAFIKTSTKLVDSYVCVSNYIQDELLKLGIPREKLIVIPNPVSDEFFEEPQEDRRRRLRARLGYDDSHWVVGFIGRFVQHKGVLDFLHLAELAEGNQSLKFLLAGQGPLYESASERVQARKMEGRVQFLGLCAEPIADFYPAIDIGVLTSSLDAFPLVAAEMVVKGIPVVSYDVGGMRDIIDDGKSGFFVPVGEPSEMYRKIDDLRQSPELLSEVRSYSRSCREKFRFSHFVSGLSGLYAQLTSGNTEEESRF